VHDPVIFASPLSGPLYVAEVQELIPDGPPSPENDAETGLVYQPFESGDRESEPSTEGGLESLATVTLLNVPPPAA
jgi:hypothetical protein